VLEGDLRHSAQGREKGLLDVSPRRIPACRFTDFDQLVKDWLKTARHPRFHRPTRSRVSADARAAGYLRANGFQTSSSSGGGIDFMRP